MIKALKYTVVAAFIVAAGVGLGLYGSRDTTTVPPQTAAQSEAKVLDTAPTVQVANVQPKTAAKPQEIVVKGEGFNAKFKD